MRLDSFPAPLWALGGFLRSSRRRSCSKWGGCGSRCRACGTRLARGLAAFSGRPDGPRFIRYCSKGRSPGFPQCRAPTSRLAPTTYRMPVQHPRTPRAGRRSGPRTAGSGGADDSCEFSVDVPPTRVSRRRSGQFSAACTAPPGPSRRPGRPTECTPAAVPSQVSKTQHLVVSCTAQPPHLGSAPILVEIPAYPVDPLGIPCGRAVDCFLPQTRAAALWPHRAVRPLVFGSGDRTSVLL